MANELKTLFPERIVTLPSEGDEKRCVSMRPIPLKKLPSVMDAFLTVFTLKQQGVDPIQMLSLALSSIIELLDMSLIDATTDDLCEPDAPFVLEAFLDLNLSETVMGKWKALFQRVGGMFPEISARIVAETKMPEQSNSPEQ